MHGLLISAVQLRQVLELLTAHPYGTGELK